MSVLSRRLLLACAAICLVAWSPTAKAVEVIGVGTDFLLHGDLTDPEDDGVETAYLPPDDLGGFDAIFFSSDEPGFEGGEFAFNVFDNQLAAGNGKWCCGTTFPQIVGADFRDTTEEAYRLTHFTVSSANDVPGRDPVRWIIEGSNDGLCWQTIFSEDDLADALDQLGIAQGTPIWTDRFQVILFEEGDDYPVQDTAYSMFRMVTFETQLVGGAFFQIGEIEFFGEESEPPADPPADCAFCSSAYLNVACAFVDGDLRITWDLPEDCDCKDVDSRVLINGAEVALAAPGDTEVTISGGDLPNLPFEAQVINCVGLGASCSPFKTDGAGYVNAQAWLALGPFATPIACDQNAAGLLTNHIGPEENIACQYPADGDPVEGYEPGDPFFPDPDFASTSGYHPSAPTDDDGNPIWRPYQDSSPGNADLDFDTDVAGNLDEHVLFLATWIENTSDEAIALQICFGSDDDGQIWLDDEVIHNNPACRGRGACQDIVNVDLEPGVHVFKIAAFEQGGGWGAFFGLSDATTLEPIIDLAGVLDPDLLVFGGISPLSADIVFHGRNRPNGFEVPDCEAETICLPVTNLNCFVGDDGSIDLDWVNSDGCTEDIEIVMNGEVIAVLDPAESSYTIEADDRPFGASVSVQNGSFDVASCSLVTVLDALLGSDLTDLDDDGLEDLYLPPDDLGGFDAVFFSSDEEGFGGGEFAFNVFDNIVGGGNDKWCCGTTFPQIVGADFTDTLEGPFLLTHFTVSSANDTPDRDPRVWHIDGSNDGEEWTTIFSQNDPNASLWGQTRLQTLLFEEGVHYPVQDVGYTMFRMVTEQTGLVGGAFFQIGEIEFFGDESGGGENCTNGVDDDGDGLVDCDDPSCAANAACGRGFERGDADASGAINITDGIFILNFLFLGGTTPTCQDAADVDDSGAINITDGIFVLNFLFLGGGNPAQPFGVCGQDPTADNVPCDTPHSAGKCAN